MSDTINTTAPAETVLDKITADIVDALRTVSTASGYNTNLYPEELSVGGNENARDGKCVVIVGDFTLEDPSPHGMDGYFQQFSIEVYIGETDTSTTPPARLRENWAFADIRRVLADDIHRGGYAAWTRVDGGSRERMEGMRILTVNVTVYYRTLENDPYKQAN